MSKLNDLYSAHIAVLKKAGVALTEYPCPYCSKTIETRVPAKSDQYDSVTTCPHCEKWHFKVVYDDGRVEVLS